MPNHTTNADDAARNMLFQAANKVTENPEQAAVLAQIGTGWALLELARQVEAQAATQRDSQ